MRIRNCISELERMLSNQELDDDERERIRREIEFLYRKRQDDFRRFRKLTEAWPSDGYSNRVTERMPDAWLERLYG